MKYLFIVVLFILSFSASEVNAQNCTSGCSIAIGNDGSHFTVTLTDNRGEGFTIYGLRDRADVERDIAWIFRTFSGEIVGANGSFIGNYVNDVFGGGDSYGASIGGGCLSIYGCDGNNDPFRDPNRNYDYGW